MSSSGDTAEGSALTAALESHLFDADASIDVEAFRHADAADDVEVTIAVGDLRVSVGMTPADLAQLRDEIDEVLDETRGTYKTTRHFEGRPRGGDHE